MRESSTKTKNEQANTKKTQQPVSSHCYGGGNASTCDGSGVTGVLSVAVLQRDCDGDHDGFLIGGVVAGM